MAHWFRVLSSLILAALVFYGLLWAFLSGALHKAYYNTQDIKVDSHACATDDDCRDVTCPYLGPILGGGQIANCAMNRDCRDEATSLGTNVSEHCQYQKVCDCFYD